MLFESLQIEPTLLCEAQRVSNALQLYGKRW